MASKSTAWAAIVAYCREMSDKHGAYLFNPRKPWKKPPQRILNSPARGLFKGKKK